MVEVVFKGVLELQKKIGDQKSWQKYLFVLKRFRSSDTASLEYYKDAKKDISKQNPKGVLNLLANYTVESLGPFPAPRSEKFHFEVRTLEQVYRLATDTRELMDEWTYFLQSQTSVNDAVSPTARSFDVRPERSEALRRIGAVDMCRLYVDEEKICLANAASGALLARWPLRCLRRYGCNGGIFNFEAGRKAPLGEGKYAFLTDEDSLMFDTVEAMVKKQAGKTASIKKSSSSKSVGIEPPLPDRNSSDSTYDRLKFDTDSNEKNPAGYSQTSANRRPSQEQPSFEEYSHLGRGSAAPSLEQYSHLNSAMQKASISGPSPMPESAYDYAITPGSKPARHPLSPSGVLPPVPSGPAPPLPNSHKPVSVPPSGYEDFVPSSTAVLAKEKSSGDLRRVPPPLPPPLPSSESGYAVPRSSTKKD